VREEWAFDQEERKRKPTGKMTLDASGNWSKMPRVMLAKCANMVALRAGWPETFAGLYAEEELDRAKVQDLTASEMVEQEREQRRMKVSALEDEFAVVDAAGNLSYVPAGRYGDQILQMAACATPRRSLTRCGSATATACSAFGPSTWPTPCRSRRSLRRSMPGSARPEEGAGMSRAYLGRLRGT
jgi:hypothetical protein